jgi:hypothetical protein
MGKKIPIVPIGTKFGEWTVIGDPQKNATKSTYYPCRCKCGYEQLTAVSKLRCGESKLCLECSRKKRHKKVIVGKKYCNWTVLELLDKRTIDGPTALCVCDCGEKREKPFHILRNCKTKLCNKCPGFSLGNNQGRKKKRHNEWLYDGLIIDNSWDRDGEEQG